MPVTFSIPAGSTFPLGATTVTASAQDAAGNVVTGLFVVRVLDTTGPVFRGLAASPDRLLVANHKLVPVTISASVADSVSPSVVTRIVSVTSSESVNGTGDGHTAPDWEVTGDLTLNLRAAGAGAGRVYAITVESRDAAGNATRATVNVLVPHDR